MSSNALAVSRITALFITNSITCIFDNGLIGLVGIYNRAKRYDNISDYGNEVDCYYHVF